MAVTHAFVSAKSDGGDATVVRPTNWNADHLITTFNVVSSTTAQGISVYNTYTDASNYERGVFDWTTTANRLTIGTQEAGSGSPRAIDIKAVDGAGPNGHGGNYGLILSSGLGGSDYLGIHAGAGVDISATSGTLMGGLHVRFAGNQLLVGANLINFGSSVGLVDVGITRNAADVIEINNGTANAYRDLRARNVRTNATTVGSLTAAATAGAGARSFVTDSSVTTFGTTVASGGSSAVPVYSDGTNWKVG